MKVSMSKFHYDRWIFLSVCAILGLGLLMVTSASMVISDRQYGYPFHYLARQAIYLGLGCLLAIVCTRIKLVYWQRIGGYLAVASVLLLIIVLIPHVGKVVNGSMRWVSIGPLSLQVSELAKMFIVIYLAGYLVRREDEIKTRVRGFLKPLLFIAVIAALLLQEPDFGTTVVIVVTALGLLFISGVRLWQFAILLALAIAAMAALAVSEPYRILRLTTFLHPWADQYNSGYQLTQSLIAFGRGGIVGVGLGNSIQKLFYLPEAHTDFLFAVLAEELGLVGELAVVALFTILIGRVLYIGFHAFLQNKNFNAYLAWGLGLGLGIQVMVNMGVNAGILPTKGLTLPLMSYGGSSMLVNCMTIGILLRVAYETGLMKRR